MGNLVTKQQLYSKINYFDGRMKAGSSVHALDGKDLEAADLVEHSVALRAFQDREEVFSLEKNGFEHIMHRSQVHDFHDGQLVYQYYYPETIELVKDRVKAKLVVPINHRIRPKHCDSNISREPVQMAHGDYNPEKVTSLLFEKTGFFECQNPWKGYCLNELKQRRMWIINVWRPIHYPVYDLPLALCDRETVEQKDVVYSTRDYPSYSIEMMLLRYNPKHSWYYYERMHPGVALLFKGYDSSQPGPTDSVFHTAVKLPISDASLPARESIEMRLACFF
ncbi:CmcJ/NvfI family oxidoreductase [Facilibium subflavum]|uniref:CmcJ/NvfI family oxidoreductase n=1 Tax=Facilibium subflavum TaxID=2219058 RepID=UPI000E65DC67|nr:CmcJ/NvfI family oxidoreductase [Facilibium subflavum]